MEATKNIASNASLRVIRWTGPVNAKGSDGRHHGLCLQGQGVDECWLGVGGNGNIGRRPKELIIKMEIKDLD